MGQGEQVSEDGILCDCGVCARVTTEDEERARRHWCSHCEQVMIVGDNCAPECCDCGSALIPLSIAWYSARGRCQVLGCANVPPPGARFCDECVRGGKVHGVRTSPPSVLDEAARLVHGDRQQAYGHPRDNHACTAELWNAYLNRRRSATGNPDYQLDAYDVCLLNDLQKTSRLAHSRHRDGLTDKVGFVANAEMVDE